MIRQAFAGLMVLVSASAFAQSETPEKAKTLDELLRMVQQGRAQESREHREREQRFAEAKTQQQRLLRDVSHELRSPLARLQAAVGLMRQKYSDDVNPNLDRVDREAGSGVSGYSQRYFNG